MDANVWKLMLQFLETRDKLGFMLTHKKALKVGSNAISWQRQAYRVNGYDLSDLLPYFKYTTHLSIDFYNPSFAPIVVQLQRQLIVLTIRFWIPHVIDTREHCEAIRSCDKLSRLCVNPLSPEQLSQELAQVVAHVPLCCKSIEFTDHGLICWNAFKQATCADIGFKIPGHRATNGRLLAKLDANLQAFAHHQAEIRPGLSTLSLFGIEIPPFEESCFERLLSI